MVREIIWAPWRAGFIQGKPEKGCVFCNVFKGKRGDDRQALIIKRGKNNFIVMNKYPYTSGHLLVVPNRHIGTLEKMTTVESNEHFRFVRLASKLLTKSLRCDGLNTGMNVGRIAGAGVLNHLHTHLVPRFAGDSNFMPIIGESRIQSFDLEPLYEILSRTLKKLSL